MNRQKTIEQIEAWLDDLLPDDEAAVLQERAENDPDFRALVELVQARRSVVETYQTGYYAQKIRRWNQPAVFRPKYFLILVLLAGAGVAAYYATHKVPPENPNREQQAEPAKATPPDTTGASLPSPAGQAASPQRTLPKLNIRFFPVRGSISIDTLKEQASGENALTVSVEPELNDLGTGRDRNSREIQTDPSRRNSPYRQGMELLRSNPDSALVRFSSIVKTDGIDYYKAQEKLAFLYAGKGSYREAALCYERYAEKYDTEETDLQLVGFYFKDIRNSRQKLMALLDSIGNEKSGHKYKKEANLLKRYLTE